MIFPKLRFYEIIPRSQFQEIWVCSLFFKSIHRFEGEIASWPRLFGISHREVIDLVSCFGSVWVVPWLLGKYFNIFKYSLKLAF